jgi:hypothetical protein
MNEDTVKLTTQEEIQIWKLLGEKSDDIENKVKKLSEQLNQLTVQINEDNED